MDNFHMDNSAVSAFLDQVTIWAHKRANVLALILVGSQATGKARFDSDIDLVIICVDPGLFLNERDWLGLFGAPVSTAIEDWGMVKSIRVFYSDGPEVEFGITNRDWIREPINSGTKRVIDDGFRILVDKTNSLARIFA